MSYSAVTSFTPV